MFRLNAIALALSGLSALAACSTVSAPELSAEPKRAALPERAGRVEPVLVVRNSGSVDSEGMYRIGRVFQGRLRYDDAVAAYRKALALDPGNVEARNALAIVYATQGLEADAEREFKSAIARSPKLSHLHSNLGYHYLRLARTEEAIASLREAVRLDPANSRALSNLAAAGRSVTPATTLGGAAQMQEPASVAAAEVAAAYAESRTPAAVAAEPSIASVAPPEVAIAPPAVVVAAPQVSVAPQPNRPASIAELLGTAPVAPKAQLVSLAPNIWELRPQSAKPVADALPVAQSVVVRRDRALPVFGSPAIARLEISNGNGVTGLARRVGVYLRTLGVPAPRLTNQRPFDQRRTQLQYVPGMEESARDLMATLGTPADLVMTPRIDRSAQMRVVLGKDFHEIEAVARAPLGAWKQVSLAPREARR